MYFLTNRVMFEKIVLVLCDDFTKSIEACNEGDKEIFS